MKKYENTVLVHLSAELDAWLNEKARNGYKKASLVRHILEKYMEHEAKWKAKPQQPRLPV